MEDLDPEATACLQTGGGGGAAEPWSVNSSGTNKRAFTPLVASPTTDPLGGLALKVAATVLQPLCLGDSPVVLPIHLQMAGGGPSQLHPAGGASFVVPSQGAAPLPQLQHLTSPLPPSSCSATSPQNNAACHSSAALLCQAAASDQKPVGPGPEPGTFPLFQNTGLAALLPDLFPSQSNLPPPAYHAPGSDLPDPFPTSVFGPPPLPYVYTSPLSSLVPPATLMVPYPIVIPLPVPLPIPIPIPVPIAPGTDLKAFADPPKPACTQSRSTQTGPEETGPPSQARDRSLQHPELAKGFVPNEEVLDLSLRRPQVQMKREVPSPQETVLDLSVASFGRRRTQPPDRKVSSGAGGRPIEERPNTALSLEIRSVECAQKLDSRLLSGLTSLQFSRQRRWMVDSRGNGQTKGACASGGNIEIVSASQTSKVIVAMKDAVPAIFRGKLKGQSGAPAKNFSLREDAGKGAILQQCYAALPRMHAEPPRELTDPLRIPKNRGIKLKKVSSQEIHILPIKKQRLATLSTQK